MLPPSVSHGPSMPRLALLTLLLVTAPAIAEEPHWAFQPNKRPAIPETPNTKHQTLNTIDQFILVKLQEKGLAFAPVADRRTLIRRVTFDLLGLPPTPEEVDAFVNDKSPERLGEGDRPLARVAALRRALGPALARPRPLRRHQRLRVRRTAARRLALSRLRHPLASTPTSPTTGSSSSNSPATRRSPATPTRLIATGFNLLGPDMTDSADQAQRRQNTLNDMTDTAGARVPRPDDRLRPLPRPQVRADPAEGLLPPAGVLHPGRVPPRSAGRHAAEKKARDATQREYLELDEGSCATRSPRSRTRTGTKLFEAKLAKLSAGGAGRPPHAAGEADRRATGTRRRDGATGRRDRRRGAEGN